MRQTPHRGRRRVGWMFAFSLAVYNPAYHSRVGPGSNPGRGTRMEAARWARDLHWGGEARSWCL